VSRSLGGFATLSLILLVAGCKVGPNYKRPMVATPPAYRGGQPPDIDTGASASLGDQKWSEVFQDPVLADLVSEALRQNFDVRIGSERVLEQEAQVGITRAQQFPTVGVGGTYTALRLPDGVVGSNNSGSGNNNTPTSFYGGGVSASAAWNLDFWGMYRRQTEAARATLLATTWAQRATQTQVVQGVVAAYLQLRSLDEQLEITRKTIDSRQESLQLTQTLEQGGAASLADVRQAEELLYAAQANIPFLQQQIEEQENAISLLLGRNPGPVARGKSITEQPHPQSVPAGIPSRLLERRPDILQAEATLISANAQIGVARAAYFPQISLSAEGGTASSQLKTLFSASNAYVYGAGALTETIFDAGRIRNNYRLAKAQRDEMVLSYQKTIAGALRDVSNALAAYQKTREYREKEDRQVAAAADAVRLARVRYQAGSTSYLEVLTNDANLYAAQLTLANAQQQEALSLVQLYAALGGGWE
jgi:outer membrane protein, multidrug efflux system